LKQEHQKCEALFEQIRIFVYQRINYLVVLLEHMDRLDAIAKRVGEVVMNK